jgi:hypothetical protein
MQHTFCITHALPQVEIDQQLAHEMQQEMQQEQAKLAEQVCVSVYEHACVRMQVYVYELQQEMQREQARMAEVCVSMCVTLYLRYECVVCVLIELLQEMQQEEGKAGRAGV